MGTMYSMNLKAGAFPMAVEVRPPDSPEVGYQILFSGEPGIVSVTAPAHLLTELIESAEAALGCEPIARGTKMSAFVRGNDRLHRRDFRVRAVD